MAARPPVFQYVTDMLQGTSGLLQVLLLTGALPAWHRLLPHTECAGNNTRKALVQIQSIRGNMKSARIPKQFKSNRKPGNTQLVYEGIKSYRFPEGVFQD